MLSRLQKYPALRTVLMMAIAFCAIGLVLTLHRYYTFYASFDQGIFNQVFWNNLHGRWFQSSLSSSLSTNVVHSGEVPEVFYRRLGQHFTPALLLWLPIYALYPHAATLTVIQIVLVTAAGLVLYVLARQHVQPAIAAMITASFYSANAILGPTLGNFHDLCQVPLYSFTLLLAMEKRWWWLFWLMAGLLLCVREDTGITLFGFGVYMVLSQRYPRTGLAVCTLGFVYVVLVTNVVMLMFSEDMVRRFPLERFGQFAPDAEEASTLDILWGMATNPGLFLEALFTPVGRKINYLLGQFLPFAFAPFFSAAAWETAGFPLLKIFLQRGESALVINIRYAMTVVPGLCYGAAIWWSTRQNWLDAPLAIAAKQAVLEARDFWLTFPQRFRGREVPEAELKLPDSPRKGITLRRFWVFCMCLSITLTLISSPNRTLYFLIPDSFDPWVYVSLPRQWQHSRHIRSFLRQIPKDASVSATTYMVPQLSSRRQILRFPDLLVRNDAGEVVVMEYVVADLWQLETYLPAFKNDRLRLESILPTIERITTNGQYGIVGFEDGIIFMQAGMPSQPEAVQAWEAYRSQIQLPPAEE